VPPDDDGIAQFGLASHGLVYIVSGSLAVQIARGHADHEANARGAPAEIARQPYGMVLPWVLAFGLASYAIWRISEAMLGTTSDGKKAQPRIASLVDGIIDLAVCIASLSLIAARSSQNGLRQQLTWTARVISHTDGRWFVGLIGVIVVVIGLVIATRRARGSVEKEPRLHEMSGASRAIVVRLGTVRAIARGIVFVLAGTFRVPLGTTSAARPVVMAGPAIDIGSAPMKKEPVPTSSAGSRSAQCWCPDLAWCVMRRRW